MAASSWPSSSAIFLGAAAMSEPDVLKLESQEVLLLGRIETVLPPLQHYFWTP